MKTTFELPADLLRRVKALAAVQGRSMKSLIAEALEDKLGQSKVEVRGWRTVFGRGTRAAIRQVDRKLAELRQVDPKDWE